MRFRWIVAALILLPSMTWPSAEANEQGYYDDYDDYYQADQSYDSAQGDVSMFYETLAPYGDWFYVPEYGYVWIPNVDHTTWRPYWDEGHWVWSDYGWMWVSSYEWGWGPFHYGRWIWLDNAYWVWVPDTVWGPAWVSWRYTDDYVGWAPLPPGAYWYPDYGLEITVSIPWRWWYFIPGSMTLDPYFYRSYTLVPSQVHQIYYRSRRATVYRVSAGFPVCVGVDINRVRRWVGAPVPQIKVTVSTTYVAPVVRRGAVVVYRPAYRMATRGVVAPPPPRRAAPAALARLYSPPPPTRSGVVHSQMYRARAAVVTPAAYHVAKQRRDVVRERNDVRQKTRQIHRDRRELRHDTRQVNQDRRELRQDRQELRHDVRTQPGNTREIRQDRQEVRESRRELNRDRAGRAHDRAKTQQHRTQRRQERRDVQRERASRHN